MKKTLQALVAIVGISIAVATFSIDASAQTATQPANGGNTKTCPNGRMNNRCIPKKMHHHMMHHNMHHHHHHMMMKKY